MRSVWLFLTCLLLPSLTAAQARTPRNDINLAFGWTGAADRTRDYDTWEGSMALRASLGRYWTDHMKSEIESGWEDAARDERYDQIQVAGSQVFARVVHRARDMRVSLSQTYQFGRNEWVHPYTGVGVDVIRRVSIVERPAQTAYAYTAGRPALQIPIGPETVRSTRLLASPFVKAGVKMYSSERTFFVTEIKFGFRRQIDHAMWKLGLGIDF
jgi:hypothetical protein